MIAESTFEDPVNEIAKEWLAKLQKANPDDEIGAANRLALQHAEATGIQKINTNDKAWCPNYLGRH